jgi:type II secretory pathway pseudopilin PulG
MSRLRQQDGFTLVEVLVACTLGIVVLFAAGGLIQVAAQSERRTSDRVQAVQRGRLVLDLMTQQLRSLVCLGRGQPAVLSAGPDEVVFVASLAAAPAASGQLQLDQRTLRFEPAAGEPDVGRIVEEVRPGTGVPPAVTFATQPSRTRVLVQRVSRVAPGAPVFRYHRYDTAATAALVELAPPVALADRERMVRIDVAFDSHPDAREDARLKTTYADQVFLRTSDPSDPTRTFQCA